MEWYDVADNLAFVRSHLHTFNGEKVIQKLSLVSVCCSPASYCI